MLLQNIEVLMKSPNENFSKFMGILQYDSIKSKNISNLNYISPTFKLNLFPNQTQSIMSTLKRVITTSKNTLPIYTKRTASALEHPTTNKTSNT